KMLEQVGRDPFITGILVDYVSSQVENDKSWQIEQQLVETSAKTFNPQSEPYLKKLEDFPVEKFGELKKQINGLISSFEKDITEMAGGVLKQIEAANLSAADFYYKERGIYGYCSQLAAGNVMKDANSYVQKSLDND